MFYEVSLYLEINFHLGYSLIHQERHQRNSVIAVFNSVIVDHSSHSSFKVNVVKLKPGNPMSQSKLEVRHYIQLSESAGKRVQTSHFWVVLHLIG